MKRTLLFLLSILVGAASLMAQEVRMTRAEYVEKYKSIAIAHMKRFGIPASITMAQGILESGAGNSDLARRSNNHFGIKCKKDWTGEKVYHDDDAKGECFRAYPTVEASYEDHAKFLDDSPRYDSLFAYPSNDYRSWARGLKAAGYATAPDYAERLVKIIEDMQLYLLDQEGMATQTVVVEEKKAENSQPVEPQPAEKKPEESQPAENKAIESKPEEIKPAENKAVESKPEEKKPAEKKPAEAQPTENKIYDKATNEAPKNDAGQDNSVAISDEHVNPNAFRVTVNSHRGYGVYRANYSSYIVAKEGDTFESIGKIFEISPILLRRFNDVQKGEKLVKGSIVYIERKQAQWLGSAMQHKVVANEDIYMISQKYGIRLKSLLKLNKMNEENVVKIGDIIRIQ